MPQCPPYIYNFLPFFIMKLILPVSIFLLSLAATFNWIVEHIKLLQSTFAPLLMGLFLCLLIRYSLSKLYIFIESLIHAITQVIFIFLCRGKILSVKVGNSPKNNYIHYNSHDLSPWKNTIIRISPYWCPLLPFVWLGCYSLISLLGFTNEALKMTFFAASVIFHILSAIKHAKTPPEKAINNIYPTHQIAQPTPLNKSYVQLYWAANGMIFACVLSLGHMANIPIRNFFNDMIDPPVKIIRSILP